MPISLPQHRRGKDASTSKTATRPSDHQVAHREAKAFVKLHGLDNPQSKADWVLVFKEMGRFLAAKSSLSNCPAPVMSMPIQPIYDSKEAMRFRAVCDERVTLPLSAFAEHPAVHSELVDLLHPDSMVAQLSDDISGLNCGQFPCLLRK